MIIKKILLAFIVLAGCEDKNKDKPIDSDEKSDQASDSAMVPAQSETLMESVEEQKEDCQEIVETARFVKESYWEGVECKEYKERITENFPPVPTQECVFPGADMRQVYEVIKRLGIEPYLEPKLPATDTGYSCRRKCSPCDSIVYKHISPKHLFLRLTYEGDDHIFSYKGEDHMFSGSGNNNIDIIEDESSTLLKMDRFWDL